MEILFSRSTEDTLAKSEVLLRSHFEDFTNQHLFTIPSIMPIIHMKKTKQKQMNKTEKGKKVWQNYNVS